MKRCIEVLLNKVFKSDLELLFGIGSYVIINYCKYSTNNLSFVIDCKVMVSDVELTKEVYPDGLILLVEESWKFIGFNEKISVVTSIDIT
jgi:hypothetical protein